MKLVDQMFQGVKLGTKYQHKDGTLWTLRRKVDGSTLEAALYLLSDDHQTPRFEIERKGDYRRIP